MDYRQSWITFLKNLSKWKAAKEWAKHYGMEFILLTEYQLGLLKGSPQLTPEQKNWIQKHKSIYTGSLK